MTARYPLVRVGANISELPAGDTLIGASSYTLPVATTTVLGGVKVDGTTITITSEGVITSVGGGGGGSYTLPPATTTTLGGVIADGTSITVDGTGKISANLASSTSQIKQLVKNNTGVTLLKGQAVYINGATGVNVTVALARANTEATSSKTLGLLEADILNGNTGYVITEGELANFDTSNAITEGDSVWLSPTTAGALVYGLANKPVAPNHVVYLGVVSRKNVSNGVILVKVQNGYELDELHNVLITTPVNGNVLKYDSVTSLWKNDVISAVTSVSGTGTVSGLTLTGTVTDSGSLTLGGTLSVDYSSLNGTVPTWNQNTTGNAANVTGTIAVANGGTGVSTFTAGLLKAEGTNNFITVSAPVGALVGTTDIQTLTNKTITAIAAYETKIAMAANTIDLSLGNCFSKTISATTTFTVSNTPAEGTAVVIILDLTNGGAFTLTWWSGVKWIGATVPTLTAAGRDMLGFITHDGGVTWSGIVLAKDIK